MRELSTVVKFLLGFSCQFQGHLREGYGKLIAYYTKLLVQKLTFHRKVRTINWWGGGWQGDGSTERYVHTDRVVHIISVSKGTNTDRVVHIISVSKGTNTDRVVHIISVSKGTNTDRVVHIISVRAQIPIGWCIDTLIVISLNTHDIIWQIIGQCTHL